MRSASRSPGACLAEDGAGLAGIAEEGAGLEALQGYGLFKRCRVACLGFEVEHLAADHALGARGMGQHGDQFAAHLRVRVGFRCAQNLERVGQEPVAGEDRGCLGKGDMGGRLAAAQIVVVHGGQVVMDQGIAVDAFERCAGAQGMAALDAE